ncbi:glycoside hydrolase family 26 protein [Mycolicibacterium arenosum]|uniref:Endoglucanase n=1 Tax=Mycolicibacterium arenosum TaxID=2952157 RepID=A0ABT1M1L8_9MYCO|nr:glycosyl hydrolase [Mycolicibacterium sp. CAU 1645]MCP9272174.1 endoglucanase [Mycolicibacterium sp. CAU 1645]
MDRPLRFGVSTPGGPLAVEELRSVARVISRSLDIVLWFEDFASPPPIAEFAVARRWGARPIVTWEPWLCRGHARNVSSEPFQLIVEGRYDAYLRRWADELRDFGSTVYVRFAHEFNGTWYPWSPAGGTSASAYTAAWRHLHSLFAAHGAANVRWVWAADASSEQEGALQDWYPGTDCVDVLAVDGYNWGTSLPGARWVTPPDLFARPLEQLRGIDDGKPILVTEVACAEAGGDKPAWIGDLVRELSGQRNVTGFVWFDHDKETDWRLTSSPESAQAMAAALQDVAA